MDKIDFQVADNFCEEVLFELQSSNEIPRWIQNKKYLFQGIRIKLNVKGLINIICSINK